MAARFPPPVEAVLPEHSVLQHCSREEYRGTPLFFGRQAKNRFDDPARGYGVLYLAEDLPTTLMESMFHKHRWWVDGATRRVLLPEVRKRMVRIVAVQRTMTLCDLASPGAAAQSFGWTTARLVVRNGPRTRALSAEIAALKTRHGQPFDGIMYLSHRNPGSRCVALFDRCAPDLLVIDDIRLDDHKDWPRFVSDYGVAVEPGAPGGRGK